MQWHAQFPGGSYAPVCQVPSLHPLSSSSGSLALYHSSAHLPFLALYLLEKAERPVETGFQLARGLPRASRYPGRHSRLTLLRLYLRVTCPPAPRWGYRPRALDLITTRFQMIFQMTLSKTKSKRSPFDAVPTLLVTHFTAKRCGALPNFWWH